MKLHPIPTVMALTTVLTISACTERPTGLAVTKPEKEFAISLETTEAIAAMPESGPCTLESVLTAADNSSNPGGTPNSWKASRGETYRLYGFAVNKDKGIVPEKIRLVLVGAKLYEREGATGSSRPDVSAAFNVPAFARAGYEVEAAFDAVDPGSYQVMVINKDGDRTVACKTFQTLTIK